MLDLAPFYMDIPPELFDLYPNESQYCPDQVELDEANRAVDFLQEAFNLGNMSEEILGISIFAVYRRIGIDVISSPALSWRKWIDARSIASALGIMSASSGMPHIEAVSMIIRYELNLPADMVLISGKVILDEIARKTTYHPDVVGLLALWLEQNGYPEQIRFNARKYSIRYHVCHTKGEIRNDSENSKL